MSGDRHLRVAAPPPLDIAALTEVLAHMEPDAKIRTRADGSVEVEVDYGDHCEPLAIADTEVDALMRSIKHLWSAMADRAREAEDAIANYTTALDRLRDIV